MDPSASASDVGWLAALGIVPMIAGLISLIVTIVAIVDIVKVPSDSDFRAGNKLVWILVVVFFNCLGAIIYYAVGRPNRTAV